MKIQSGRSLGAIFKVVQNLKLPWNKTIFPSRLPQNLEFLFFLVKDFPPPDPLQQIMLNASVFNSHGNLVV